MTHPVHSDEAIRTAGAERVRRWRTAGWSLSADRADRLAALLLPTRDVLAGNRSDPVAKAA